MAAEEHVNRSIPSVDAVVRALEPMSIPRSLGISIIRETLQRYRGERFVPPFPRIVRDIQGALEEHARERIQRVINATGILVHTNLGRSPLAPEILDVVKETATSYNNLEMDLLSGKRGGRSGYLERGLALLCGSEAAMVVNNCASALVLMVRHFISPRKREVIVSRGELIQIGGGFRIPEILAASGAVVHEVGTTNRTSLRDYDGAINPKSALILVVHRSNFYIEGFVASPTTRKIAALAQEEGIPLIEDLGSGALHPIEELGPEDRVTTPLEALQSGADLVCFSGDKLLGGPQAGIIAGSASLISRLKEEPLFRALRCDKMILTALQGTIDAYLDDSAEERIPLLAVLQISIADLEKRAREIVDQLSDLPVGMEIVDGQARIGGGALPRAAIPSIAIELRPHTMPPQALAESLRTGRPPVVGRVVKNSYRIDMRTVFAHQDDDLTGAVRAALEPMKPVLASG